MFENKAASITCIKATSSLFMLKIVLSYDVQHLLKVKIRIKTQLTTHEALILKLKHKNTTLNGK